MNTILFNCYRKYLKDNKKTKSILNIPLKAKLLLIGILVCIIYSIIASFVASIRNTYFISVIVEVVLCTWLYFYTESFQIKNSDDAFLNYQNYCEKIYQWLICIGIVVTKDNLKELIMRLEKEIEEKERERLLKREHIEKCVHVIIFPVFLAVFSAAIREQKDLKAILSYAIVFFVIIFSVVLLAYGIYLCVDFLKKTRLEQLKRLSNDLQGVLDCRINNNFLKTTKSDDIE